MNIIVQLLPDARLAIASSVGVSTLICSAYFILHPPNVEIKSDSSLFPNTREFTQNDFGVPTLSVGRYLILKIKILLLRYVAFALKPLSAGRYTEFVRASSSGAPLSFCAYHPPNYNPKAHGGRPIYVNLHGGGFCAGESGSDFEFCEMVAETSDSLVVCLEYPLAPENPYPAAVDSIIDTIEWLQSKYSPSSMAVGGFSAGGTLALCAAQRAASRLAAAVAFYPVMDFSSASQCQGFDNPDPHRRNMYHEAYLLSTSAAHAALAHPHLSPRYADASALPPAVVLVAPEVDPNILDIKDFIARMQRARPAPPQQAPASPPPPSSPAAAAAPAAAPAAAAAAPPPPPWFACRCYPGQVHGWTHIPEFVLRRLKSPDGAPLGAVEAKRDAYRFAAAHIRLALAPAPAAPAAGGGG